MEHILRIYIHEDKAGEQLRDIIEYCQKTHCHEVMLLTTGYFTQPSFVSLEDIESYTQKLAEWSDFLRKNGIKVSLNVIQTLGHKFFPKESLKEFPFQRQIVLDGGESASSACPLCQNLKDYLIKAYKLYAQVKPRLLFADDDFRFITGGGMGCFCPLHLDKLAEALGRKITFENLTEAIFSDSFSTHEIRKTFHEVLNSSMMELAKALGKAVNEVSSETKVGFMSSVVPQSTWGCDLDQIAHMFAGRHRPFFRPQIPMYTEFELKYLPRCFSQPSYARKMFNSKVEQYPEVENAYYTVFAKSAQVTFLQMTSCLLNGMNKITMLIFDWLGTPFAEGEEYISMLSEKWKFFEVLSKIIPEGSMPQGIGIPLHKHSTVVRRTLDAKRLPSSVIDPRRWDNYIPLLGLPVGFDWKNDTYPLFLTGDDILAFSLKEVESFLQHGAIMDVRAAECLCSLGFSDRIGVQIEESLKVDNDLYLEEFHIDTIKKTFIPLVPVSDEQILVKKIKLLDKNNTKIMSSIINRKKEYISPAVVAYINPQGERFGIIAYSPENESRALFLNKKRKSQMRWLFEWISKNPLPVSVINAPYVQPVFHKMNKNNILALFNYSTDSYESIIVSLPWYKPLDYNVYRLAQDGNLNKLDNIIHAGNTLWEIPANLVTANLEVIVFEKNNEKTKVGIILKNAVEILT